MSKFSTIQELYPNNYQDFYPQAEIQEAQESEDDFELDVPEPMMNVGPNNQVVQTQVPNKKTKKKVSWKNPISETGNTEAPKDLKGKLIHTVKSNLINIVIILIGYILVSNEAVSNIIDEKITKNSIAGMAIRGIGLVLIYIVAKILSTLFMPR